MGVLGSAFGSLGLNISKGLAGDLIGAGFYSSHYKKRDGSLKFISNRGYDSVFVYAAKRTALQASMAMLNDLYPKYQRHFSQKRMKESYQMYQGDRHKKLVKDGKTVQSDFDNLEVGIKYRGQIYDEGLLMWIPTKSSQSTSHQFRTYWDTIKGLSAGEKRGNISFDASGPMADGKEMYSVFKIKGETPFWDLGPIVKASSGNETVITKVQGRDYSRKELISNSDTTFTVTGTISTAYPDQYPYDEVEAFLKLMRYKGVIAVHNLMFQQFRVNRILIKDFSLTQNKGYKNIQPYSFTCIGVEPDDPDADIGDTIDVMDINIVENKKSGWAKFGKEMLDKVANAAVNEATKTVGMLTSKYI